MSSEPTFAILKCKTSVSQFPNNLSLHNNSILFAHRNEVIISQDSRKDFSVNDKCEQNTKCAYNEKDFVSTVGYYKVSAYSDEPVIIVGNCCGYIGIYDVTGEVLLNSHKLMKSQVALASKDAYIRAIATNSVDKLYAATGNGEVIVFSLANKKMTLLSKINVSTKAIHSLTYDVQSKLLAAGDENGTLSVFKNDSTLAWSQKALHQTEPTNVNDFAPITIIGSGHGFIVTGDTLGKLKFYSIEKKELVVEVNAHARPISCMDIHPTSPVIIVGSEDTFISVWNIPTSSPPQMKNLGLFSPATQIVTGVRFVASGGDKSSAIIKCAIYDSRSVFCTKIDI